MLGGDKPDGTGYFMQPTIVANPALDSRVAREETFGPVLPIWRVSDLDEAIGLANDTEYGLGASVWTNDIRIIHRVANEVEAGMKWVNQFHYGYDELPFGGVKQSGYGKEHGVEGLDYYLEDISVVDRRARVDGGLVSSADGRRRLHHARQAARELLRQGLHGGVRARRSTPPRPTTPSRS